jgi:hypothetical protein
VTCHRCQTEAFKFGSALKIKATDSEPAKEQTPTMAQGITNHVWTVEQLLGGF